MIKYKCLNAEGLFSNASNLTINKGLFQNKHKSQKQYLLFKEIHRDVKFKIQTTLHLLRNPCCYFSLALSRSSNSLLLTMWFVTVHFTPTHIPEWRVRGTCALLIFFNCTVYMYIYFKYTQWRGGKIAKSVIITHTLWPKQPNTRTLSTMTSSLLCPFCTLIQRNRMW